MKTAFPFLFCFFFLSACATYTTQFADKDAPKKVVSSNYEENKVSHTIFLIGDAGNAPMGETLPTLEYLKEHLEDASENSSLVFLGDNIYPLGMPKKNTKERALAEHRLQIQIDAVRNYKGSPIFIPGNHDWYNGLKGLKRQEKMVENALGKKSFLPEDGCGIKKVELNDSLTLILIDSKWYITDWDNHPTINEDCDIKTRDRFLKEFSRILKKNRYKNVVVALHHPLYSNGPHGGHFSFKDHMKPLPILGSLKNIIRANAGIQTDNFNKSYTEFIEAIETEVEDFKENVVFVSGHEHNLQYIEKEGVKQVVSGAGSKQSAARAGFEAPFSYGNKGFAKLTFYDDGSAVVSYYAANKTDKNKLLYSKEIIRSFKGKTDIDFSEYDQHNKFVEASIYPKSQTDVSGFHKFIWGDLNRDKYGTKVKVPVLELDSVFGGLTPIRQGGGQQTNSLRLENSEGKQYMLRTMEKDGSRIMDGILDDTFLIDVVHDLFTTSDPFAAFVIPDMAKAVHIYHTNPKLYYMPKQPQLENYNDLFGGKLYLLEERPAHNREDVNSFGNSKDIISTYDVLEKIRKNGNHYIDQDWVIRSRLFDMVIGDWDRHEDQWRWASFEQEDGRTMYRPIPRDRDQPFSRFDGVMIPLIKAFITEVKNMQNFDDDIKDMKWFNYYPKYFDAEFLNGLSLEAWQKQATFIQEHLTDEIIEASIKKLPSEIYKIDGAEIIYKLKSRRDKLASIAKRYYERFAKTAYVIGTDKDDVFTVTRVNDAKTKVLINRKNSVLYERIFSNEITKEIQIFGLNGKDTFNVSGDVNDGILLRLVGGQDEDTYNDSSTVSGWSKKTKVYDFKSKRNTLLKNKETADKRSDNYVRNIYNIHDIKNNTTIVIPSLGINPDDGFFFGATATYTKQAYKKYPFGSKQSLGANYFSATSGFEIKYNGEFTEILGKWNLLLNAVATSDNYSINFFGWGNESIYDQENDLDYYRVKKSELSFSPSLVRRFRGGNSLRFSSSIEGIKIQNTPGRNIADFDDSAINIFERNYFLGGEVNVNHQRVDEASFPTKGMHFDLSIGAKAKADDFNRRFGYLKSSLALYKNLVQNRSLVWASEIGTNINFGNRFEFYQAATLGGDRNLRGYNRERFTGKESFYHSNDLRLRFGEIQTGIIPIKIGITGGFDYGRIWSPKEPDNKTWHTSYGGSLWITGIDIITLNVSYFRGNSREDRIAFSVGFSF